MTISAEAIMAVFASEAGVDPATLDPAMTLPELDISSLDIASAVFELEDQFGIEVDLAKIPPEMTLAQLTAHIQALAEAKATP
jgi:acyl carrier protein